uniref:Putative insect allergen related repeat protein n=1 Tax=Xenopsylla cheopis TaxID=163159 RepID=A0A6M2DY64_XENCH
MADEIIALLPLDKIVALFYDKMENSPEFAEAFQKIADSYDVFAKIAKFPEVIELADRLRELGVDVDAIIDFFKSFFGWSRQARATRGLAQDVDEFAALIPHEKIADIVREYIANDKEVQHIVEYLKSDKFEVIVVKIAAVQEIKDYVHYLEGKGVKIIEVLNKIAELLGLPTIPTRSAPTTRGWRDMADEIIALLPLDKIVALFYDKMENSPEFAEAFQKIADSYDVFAKIAKFPEVIELADRLRELGVDVDAIIDFFKSFFGWN